VGGGGLERHGVAAVGLSGALWGKGGRFLSSAGDVARGLPTEASAVLSFVLRPIGRWIEGL